MKEFLYKLSNWILGLFGVAAAVGLAYTLFPDYFSFAFNALGMTEDQVAMATVVLSGITVFGGMSKYLGGVVKTQQVLVEQRNTLKINTIEEKHEAEIQLIKNEKHEETKIYSSIVNELIANQNLNNDLLKDIIQVLAITARRNANSDSKLISEEDKALYRQFLEGLSKGEDLVEVESLYTTLTVIEKEEVKEEKDTLEERL